MPSCHSENNSSSTSSSAQLVQTADSDAEKNQLLEQQRTVADWVKYFGEKEMGVFAGTLAELNRISRDTEAEVAHLSRIILGDPVLTTRVLKVANSALHKLSGGAITTVSRAIVVLGFSIVRDIAVSLKVLETMLGDARQTELMQPLADAYHSAMQAKSIAHNHKPSDQEEIFIAALLRNIGISAFISVGGESNQQLLEYLHAGLDTKTAVDKCFGFDCDRLTMALTRAWSLGDLLTEVVSIGERSRSSPVQAAVLGDQVTQASKLGWDSEEFQSVLEKISELTGRSVLDCEQEVMAATKETRSQAVNYGVDKIKHLIPEPIVTASCGEESDTSNQATAKKGNPVDHAPLSDKAAASRGDKTLQLEIIRELNGLVGNGNIDLNTTLSMVMEGMHRGIGLDRVGFFLTLMRENKKIL